MADRENILVTGGGSGIGRAVAIRMGKQMTVIVADLNEDGANETVVKIEKAGGTAYAIKTDVSDSASVRDMKDFIAKDIGPVSKAFIGAGIFIRGVVGQIPEEDWDRMIDIHVKGTLFCAQAVLPDMVAAGRGAIVTMSSDFAVMAVPGAAATSSSGIQMVPSPSKSRRWKIAARESSLPEPPPPTLSAPRWRTEAEAEPPRACSVIA